MRIQKYSYRGIPVSLPVRTGFGIAPVVAAGSLAMKLISGIGSLFGAKPRGEYQKFQRNLYPYMRTAAAQTGLPVFCGWFGEWVGVNPDGSFGVTINKETMANGYYPGRAEMETYKDGAFPFYRTDGPKGSDIVNHPDQAYFELYDPLGVVNDLPAVVGASTGTTTPAGSITPSGTGLNISPASSLSLQSMFTGDSLMWIALAGVAAFILFGNKKKG